MKLRFITLLFLLVSILSFSQQTNAPTTVDVKMIEEDFDQLLEDVSSSYAYLDEEVVSLSCVKDYYSTKIKALKTKQEVLLFFEHILMEFYDNHFLLNRNNNKSYRTFAPIYLSSKDDKIIVENVWTSNSINLEINILKAEVLSFNGVAFSKVIEDFPIYCADKNNLKVREYIVNKIIFGTYNQPRILELKLNNGAHYTLDIDKIVMKKTSTLLSSRVENNIGIITINNSLGENKLITAFDKTLDKLLDTKAIILDLRNTVSGGNTYVAKGIMSRFISKEKAYQKHSLLAQYDNQPKIYRNFVEYVVPRGKQYKKPLIVLAGRWTGSMGEGLTIGLDGLQRATIVGTELQKLQGAIYTIPFGNSSFAYNMPVEKLFHVNNTPRENFTPKIHINQQEINKDEFLLKAINLLNKKH